MVTVAIPTRLWATLLLVWSSLASNATFLQQLPAQTPSESSAAAIEFFESKVRPLLVENCQSCHGPKTQWAGLRLDSRAALLEGGDSGPAFTPDAAAESELLRRITSADASEQMPPPESKKHLNQQQVETLTAWIKNGAIWGVERDPAADQASDGRDHWAFQPIAKPAVPDVGDNAWPQNELDRFVLQRLDQAGLTPSAPADRRSLIRRVTYDLIGLPPTPDEVSAFVNDASPDAYPKLVERLLASPGYGEHWGRHWLDIARYSDTKGYVYGREEHFFVHSSIYRDWVIQALNDDMPYDRFLLLQLAADQAEPDNPAAAAALGFITLGRRFLGVQPDIIDDRIDVVTRGTMGLTVGCARCHDHKFDPIPTADYYSLYGVFQNCAEVTVPLPKPDSTPSDAEPTPFEVELQKRKTALADKLAERRAEFGQLGRKRIGEYLAAQFELDKYPETSFSQILSKEDLLPSTVRRWQKYLEHAAKAQDPVFAVWTALASLPQQDFALQAEQALAALDPQSIHPKIAAAFATAPKSTAEIVDRYAQVLTQIEQQWQAEIAKAAEQKQPLPTQLADPADEQLRQVLYGVASPCVIPDFPIVNIEFDVDTSSCVELWGLQSAVDQWILTNPTAAPHAVILQDKPVIHNPRIFRRGNPTNLGEEVPLRFLQILSGEDRQPFSQGSGRLELAQAITSASNPLTARVWVNRVWAYHFGEGLVRTTSDFGTRADPPSHPELLDWLAARFIESGWSTKSLHRAILLSAAYQQNSLGPISDEQYANFATTDPENRLLWKMNPQRLSFEEIRDAYLAISDDLDRQMGGKGVDLFTSTPNGMRRTIYSIIDRQSLPSVLRVFDFANPDLHTPQRSETTVPQQALFALNHAFVADRARSLAAATEKQATDDAARVNYLYQQVLQRDPTPPQLAAALAYLESSLNTSPISEEPATIKDWTYGYGEIDAAAGQLLSFTPLPFFTGTAWQGGSSWPDASIGWAQITADGGHPGNDLKHAIVRRWTAPAAGNYAIASTVKHNVAAGDGIRCWVLTRDSETIRQELVHNREQVIDIESIELQAGDTLDFVVDIYGGLNSDQHLWTPKITLLAANETSVPSQWDGERDFSGPMMLKLNPWEQLAQVLLISNELLFVD